MKCNSKLSKILIISVLSLCGSWSIAEDTKKVEADSSGINVRDRKPGELTAESQSESTKEDVDLTRRIRLQLTKDNKLSTNAENIKIVTINGVTTLKGPVSSIEEKKKVGMHVQEIVGSAKVNNELEVVKNQ
jgi:osmotically-inducible protein OsmY